MDNTGVFTTEIEFENGAKTVHWIVETKFQSRSPRELHTQTAVYSLLLGERMRIDTTEIEQRLEPLLDALDVGGCGWGQAGRQYAWSQHEIWLMAVSKL